MRRPSARLRLPIGLCVAVTAACACRDEPARPRPLVVRAVDAAAEPASLPTSQPTARSAAPPSSEGHARMVARLAQIRAETDTRNPYLGAGEARQLQAQLDELGPDAPAYRRYGAHFGLGGELLEIGETERAIAHFEAAQRLVETLPAKLRPVTRVQSAYWLAIAWLRLAETENCAQLHTGESCILPIRGGGVHRVQRGARNAAKALERVLELPGDKRIHVAAQWLLNLAYQTLGEYPEEVPAKYLIDPARFRSEHPTEPLVDVAPALGLAKFDLSGGAIVDDFDGDGWLDIVTSSWDTAERLAYYRNHGDGRFTERGVEAGFEGILGGLNMVQADYDNDGDVDILVLRGAWLQDAGAHPNSLLRNDGHGVFSDVTYAAGLGAAEYPTQTASFGDFDLDGDLDIYIGNEARNRPENPAQLFRNNGDGTFTDVAERAGVQNWRYAKGVVFGDYDDDRWPDLYVSNMNAGNRLYRNQGDGTFVDVAPKLGVTRPHIGFPAWFWDFDNDGALDILAMNGYGTDPMEPPVWNVAASHMGLPHQGERMRLYRNDGRGGFTDVAPAAGLTLHTTAMGCNFGDLNNDGRLDLYVGTGYPQYEGLMPNLTYLNLGAGRFADVTFSSRMGHLQKGHGVAFADLDQDGDQDVFIQLGGAFPGDKFGNALFRNPGGGGWIVVELRGVRSNRSAIGAHIELDVTDGGVERTITRRVNSGGSFGANPLRQHLGVGAAQKIDALRIYWPASDTTQTFRDVPVRQFVRITEGVEALERRPYPSFELAPGVP